MSVINDLYNLISGSPDTTSEAAAGLASDIASQIDQLGTASQLGCGLIKPEPQSYGGEFCEGQIG